jgi:integrase
MDLFRDASLLGRALVDDRSADGSRLSKWTLAQRRSAIRSFANLMRPELLVLLGEEPANVVDRALRSVADRIGGGYRLSGGAPRQRGGRAPSRDEVTAVLGCLGNTPGITGLRNRTFYGILAATGCRVNALRELDGSDCLVLPTGRMRIYLHEKGKIERREVELSREAACDLIQYTDAFNRLAASRRWTSRVGAGKPGAVWRNSAGSRWGYASIVETLKDGCIRAGVPEFAPHALRRAFASDAASLLPRHVVAQAGGWKGLERVDDHYIQPHETTIWQKLNRLGQDTIPTTTEMEINDVAVAAV